MSEHRAIAIIIAALVATTAEAHAERRAFTNAFEALTIPTDNVQVDVSTTQSYGFSGDRPRLFRLELDAALGLTDRWDIAAFQVYDEATDEEPMTADVGFHYTESRFRTRYRFAERGQLPVDLLGMLDVSKAFRTSAAAKPKFSVNRIVLGFPMRVALAVTVTATILSGPSLRKT